MEDEQNYPQEESAQHTADQVWAVLHQVIINATVSKSEIAGTEFVISLGGQDVTVLLAVAAGKQLEQLREFLKARVPSMLLNVPPLIAALLVEDENFNRGYRDGKWPEEDVPKS